MSSAGQGGSAGASSAGAVGFGGATAGRASTGGVGAAAGMGGHAVSGGGSGGAGAASGGAPGGVGGQIVAAGAGGTPATAGAAGSLSMSSGGGGAASGAGGSGGASAGASGAAGMVGSGGAAGGSDCSALPLCDSFESTAVGSPPNSALWTLIPTSASGTATVDAMGAHGSAHSLKVVSPDRLFLRNTSVIGTLGPIAHVRFYVRFGSTLGTGHGALIVTHPTMVDQYTQSNELRFGGQDQVFHWNTDSDAANIPDVSPNGDMASLKPAADTWYCIELTIDTSGNLSTSIDGTDIAGLKEDGTPTANVDQAWIGSSASLARYKTLADFNFGWQSFGAGALTLWYDDVALSASPIGCN
jgi:hypothetical protein